MRKFDGVRFTLTLLIATVWAFGVIMCSPGWPLHPLDW